MMKTFSNKPILLILIILVSGCGSLGQSEFTCSGTADGAPCIDSMTSLEVSDDDDFRKEYVSELKHRRSEDDDTNSYEVLEKMKGQRNAEGKTDTTNFATAITQPLPVLEPARVIRIYIKPWIDEQGDLHIPGLLFTEITPRKWSFGAEESLNTQIPTPIIIGAEEEDRNGRYQEIYLQDQKNN